MTTVRPAKQTDKDAWLQLRVALWPDGSEDEHRHEIEQFLAGRAQEPLEVLVAEDKSSDLVGFVELSVRPCAEGCRSTPVAYLEGWFVKPEARRKGVGHALVSAAEVWSQLSIDSQNSAQVWRIHQEHYSSQLAKLTYVPDGHVVASLPVRMSQDPTAETAFGHLAVFCSYAGGETIRCDGVKFVFSNGVATSRGQQRTIEQVLSDVLESD